jgi:hypothetical protein
MRARRGQVVDYIYCSEGLLDTPAGPFPAFDVKTLQASPPPPTHTHTPTPAYKVHTASVPVTWLSSKSVSCKMPGTQAIIAHIPLSLPASHPHAD